MENQFMLPIGIEDFKEIREEGYYYVDKTALIEQVLEKRSKVTLYQAAPLWKIIKHEYVKTIF